MPKSQPSARQRLASVAGILALSLLSIAGSRFPSFRLTSKLKLPSIPMPLFLFHHEENQPVTIATGDFNGDGMPDLVVGSLWDNEYSNEITLFPGRGDGTFGAPTVTKLNARPQELQVADLNGDGISDVALVTNPQIPGTEDGLWVFLGTKDGPLKSAFSVALHEESSGIFLADFDGDGQLDLAVSTYSSIFRVFRGRGDGTFEEPRVVCRCDVSLVADFNGDHLPDLVVRDGMNAAVRMNRGDGRFGPPVTFSGQAYREVTSTADLNGDGIPDLIFANRREHGISIYPGNGDGTFRPPGSLETGEIHAIRIADMDGDGLPDLLAAVWRRGRDELLIFPGLGNGSFRAPIVMRTDSSPSDIAIADFNRDRKPDLAISSMGAQSISVFLQAR
jgi:hypothetical protein